MMEMQDKVIQNDFMCDEAHDVENDNEELRTKGGIQIMLKEVYQF